MKRSDNKREWTDAEVWIVESLNEQRPPPPDKDHGLWCTWSEDGVRVGAWFAGNELKAVTK